MDNDWLEFLVGNVCGLCGNTGTIRVTGVTKPDATPVAPVTGYCICPNGRTIKHKQNAWLQDAVKTGEKIEKSAIFFSLVSKSYKKDPLCALQLGIALLLGKPLAIISVNGEKIPEQLSKLAFAVEQIHGDMPQSIQAAADKIIKKAKAAGIINDPR